MPEPVLIVGGQIAGLVAADALTRAGRDVRLVLPERGVGGGFLPLERDGRRLELGVRVLELGYEDDGAPASLAGYVPGFGAHRAHTRRVADLVRDAVGEERLVDLPAPTMVVDGRAHPDVYFTVDLTGLPAILGAARTAAVAREAARAREAWGDAGLLAGDLGDMTLEAASLANHGPTLHAALIAPPAEKFLRDGARRTLAAWRRKVWMPLFWPRTLAEACTGAPAFRGSRRFTTVAGAGPGEVVRALLERVRRSPHATVETAGAVTALHADGALEIDGLGTLRPERPILACAPKELFAAAGTTYDVERARSVIAWVEVDEDDLLLDPSLLHVVDPGNPVARVSEGSSSPHPGRRLLTVELRHDLEAEAIDDAAAHGLRDAGVLVHEARVTPVFRGAMPTFDAPTRETRDALQAARAHVEALGLDATVVGGAAGAGADSFNEQVVAGLAAAEERA
ncbi:MAG TPA: NAD(P)-binding protein [Baekduia sp.]|nr:NAD(P)-binding protein [Baekduia sp.]